MGLTVQRKDCQLCSPNGLNSMSKPHRRLSDLNLWNYFKSNFLGLIFRIVPPKIPIVIPNWYRKYNKTSNVLGVRSVKRLIPVKINSRELKKKTNNFMIPWRFVIFKITKVITVTEIANTVRNPVFIPKIRNNTDASSPGLPADKLDNSIFSGEANRGTLRIAFAKNKTNRVIDTVFRWFCNRGNLTRIARPKIIPWNSPTPNAPITARTEKIGSWNTSTRNGIRANASHNFIKRGY